MKESFSFKRSKSAFEMDVKLSNAEKLSFSSFINEFALKKASIDFLESKSASLQKIGTSSEKDYIKSESNDKFTTASNSSTNSYKPSESSIDENVDFLFGYLLNTNFEPGYLSVADEYFEKECLNKSIPQISHILNLISMKCYEQTKNHSYLHFLNLLKNATYSLPFETILPFGIIGVSNKDREIKDLSLSLFESFNYKNNSNIQRAITILVNLDTIHYMWLENYKNEIIEDLRVLLREENNG
ncbi:MAG: hypothetical protein E6736_13490 [Leclercia adecarboxylata]|nr:hypothetical protein [Leclercia adecarboxylata]